MDAKCIKFHEFGRPEEVLKVENTDVRPPGSGEILVRMIARPINPSDLIPIRGSYSHRIPLPCIPGYEGVGVVEEVGPAVSQDLLGKRVLPLRGEGTWQDYVKTTANLAIPVPPSIEDDIAAQLYINPITAWITATEVLALKPGDFLLVNACGSSIGGIFAQLSRILGFKLIAVTRNDAYTRELLQLGASYVINTSIASLYQSVMEITGGWGATAGIDSVGGAEGTELAYCLQPNGNYLAIGLLSGKPVSWTDISKKARVNLKLFHLRHWNSRVSLQTWQETFNNLISLIIEKKLIFRKPASYYCLMDVKEAVCMAQSPGRNRGKIFLT